jgi:hypothetical protein
MRAPRSSAPYFLSPESRNSHPTPGDPLNIAFADAELAHHGIVHEPNAAGVKPARDHSDRRDKSTARHLPAHPLAAGSPVEAWMMQHLTTACVPQGIRRQSLWPHPK